MSRSGNVKHKSLYCGMRCVLLAAVIALSGCSGTSGPGGSIAEQQVRQEAAAEQAAGQEAAAEQESGQEAAAEQAAALEEEADQEAVHEQPAGRELTDVQPAGPEVTAEQSVQEIVAEPVRIRGRLPEVYDPNPAYDRYALVEYVVDDIGAEFTATVSAEDDGSEYEVHCTLGKAEQIVILDEDYNVIYDRTGSMGDDAPLIVQAAVEEDNWRAIGD